MTNKTLFSIIGGFVGLLILLWINPIGYNDPKERTVITFQSGEQDVQFGGGMFYEGFFSRTQVYPNQIGVQYKGDGEDLTLNDNTVDIGRTQVSFLGGATATVQGIVQFNLPNDKETMIDIHNSHGSIEGLVRRRLAPYTQECLSASAQLMTPEMHYNGGKAQMSQDYIDQLRGGSFLLETKKISVYDSIEKSVKPEYIVIKQLNKNGEPKRKFSSIKEYNITVGDAQITKTDYEPRIVAMLGKQIEAQAAASVAKQEFVTAQQTALTEEARGKAVLVRTEYAKKVEQTKQIVAAQTKVELAKTYRMEQEEAAKASVFAAQKIRTDADAESYKNRQLVAAGLTPQEGAALELQKVQAYAKAIENLKLPSTYIIGGKEGSQSDILNALLTSKLIVKD